MNFYRSLVKWSVLSIALKLLLRNHMKIFLQVVVCGASITSEFEGAEALRLVVARVPSTNNETKNGNRTDAMREVRFLSGLSDPNLARVLGVCTADPAPWTIIEYTELGDLAHYLQYSEPLTGTQRPNCSLNFLR